MMKTVVAVIAGYLAWTALWLGGGAGLGAAFPEEYESFRSGGPFMATVPLVASLALSVVCSLVAGVVTARLSGIASARAVMVVGILLLVTGIAVQASVWNQMPVWYHLVFLGLLMPMVKIGARFGSS